MTVNTGVVQTSWQSTHSKNDSATQNCKNCNTQNLMQAHSSLYSAHRINMREASDWRENAKRRGASTLKHADMSMEVFR